MGVRAFVSLTATLAGCSLALAPSASAATATPIGPEGGQIEAIDVSRHLILARIADGFEPTFGAPRLVWASDDKGVSWRPATDPERKSFPWRPSLAVRHPRFRSVLYRLIRDGRSDGLRFEFSRDGGRHFELRNGQPLRGDHGVPILRILATRRTTFLVGSSGPLAENRGIRRSIDGGRTWIRTAGLSGRVSEIWPDPTRPHVAYALASVPSGKSRLYRSTTAGATWRQIGRGLPTMLDDVVPSISISPIKPSVLVSADGNGVFRSADFGATWKRVISTFGTTVAHDITHPAIVYAGSLQGLYRSSDNGRTWRPANAGLLASRLWSLDAVGTPTRLYAAGLLGPFALMSSAGTLDRWSDISPRRVGIGISIAGSQSDPALLAGTTLFQPLKTSRNAGADWMGEDESIIELLVDPMTDSLYAMRYDVLVVSNDLGATWRRVGAAPPRDLFLSSEDTQVMDGHIYAWDSLTAGRLYHSSTGGRTWRRTSFPSLVGSVAPAPSDPDTVYVSFGFLNQRIARSHDGGSTWSTVYSSRVADRDLRLTTLAVDRSDPNRVFGASSTLGLLMSTDGARTWRQVARRPLTGTRITPDPNDSSRVFVATQAEGVWRIEGLN